MTPQKSTRPWLSLIVASCLSACWPLQASVSNAAKTKASDKLLSVTIPYLSSDHLGHSSYQLELLKLALEASKQPGETIQVQQASHPQTQAREIAELRKGQQLDLLWTMTSRERESALRVIRIPLLKGLLGQRIFLIHRDRIKDFSHIQSLQQLQQLAAGQVSHWPDTEILLHNGLDVTTSANFSQLFNMLENGRFDYFPRGATEAWHELQAHADKPLMIEPNLLLSYTAPMYFFVSPNNPQLAQRVETGLESMLADGSFDQHFYNHPSIRFALKNINLKQRRTFKLINPLLPAKTPVDVKRYWLDLDTLNRHTHRALSHKSSASNVGLDTKP